MALVGKMLRKIMGEQRGMRVIGCRLDGTGTAAILEGGISSLTLVDNGTGDYTLTFAEPYKRVPLIVATSVTADINITIGTLTTTSVQLLATDLAAAATDADMHIMIMGWDAEDEI